MNEPISDISWVGAAFKPESTDSIPQTDTARQEREQIEKDRCLFVSNTFFANTGLLSTEHPLDTGELEQGTLDQVYKILDSVFSRTTFSTLEEIRALTPLQKGALALYISLKFSRGGKEQVHTICGLQFDRYGGSGRDKFEYIRQQQLKFNYKSDECEFAEFFLLHFRHPEEKNNYYELVKERNFVQAMQYLSGTLAAGGILTTKDLAVANKIVTQELVPDRFSGALRNRDARSGVVNCSPAIRIPTDLGYYIQTLNHALSRPIDDDASLPLLIADLLRQYDAIHPFLEGGGRTMSALMQVVTDRLAKYPPERIFEPVGDYQLILALKHDTKPKDPRASYSFPEDKVFFKNPPDYLAKLVGERLEESREKSREPILEKIEEYKNGQASPETINFLRSNLKRVWLLMLDQAQTTIPAENMTEVMKSFAPNDLSSLSGDAAELYDDLQFLWFVSKWGYRGFDSIGKYLTSVFTSGSNNPLDYQLGLSHLVKIGEVSRGERTVVTQTTDVTHFANIFLDQLVGLIAKSIPDNEEEFVADLIGAGLKIGSNQFVPLPRVTELDNDIANHPGRIKVAAIMEGHFGQPIIKIIGSYGYAPPTNPETWLHYVDELEEKREQIGYWRTALRELKTIYKTYLQFSGANFGSEKDAEITGRIDKLLQSS